MQPAQHTSLSPKHIAHVLKAHAKLWLIPTVAVAALAAVYAIFSSPTWEASQALIIRDEATNSQGGPGEFSHRDEMKTVQETILELVKSRSVLAEALREVGPTDGRSGDEAAWPKPDDVAKVRKAVKLKPPKGSEFGTTEVFYLNLRAGGRERAVALNRAICDQLLTRFQQLRDTKAQSMIDELVKTVRLAQTDLNESTAELTKIEQEVGSDLAELRALNDRGSGDSALHRTITEIRNELRQISAAEEANRQLLALLKEAEQDPGTLVAMPNRLLESQPALRRLKDGLIDAQISTAALKGTMSDEHPRVRSAREAENEIGRHLHNELAIAIRGLEVELQMNADRQATLQAQLAEAGERLDRLAGLRAAYANQVAETDHRSTLVERAEQNLAEARATHASANAASLISRIDAPDAGIHPISPSRSTIVLVGLAGGLVAGLGILLLTVPPTQWTPARRIEEELPPRATPTVSPVLRSREQVLQRNGNLSLKQALQKVAPAGVV